MNVQHFGRHIGQMIVTGLWDDVPEYWYNNMLERPLAIEDMDELWEIVHCFDMLSTVVTLHRARVPRRKVREVEYVCRLMHYHRYGGVRPTIRGTHVRRDFAPLLRLVMV